MTSFEHMICLARLEGAAIGHGRVPLPGGPEIVAAECKVVLR
jgi:hypothetical protein